MAESEEEQKSLLMRVKEESEKAGLKLNIQKTKIMASGPIVQACLLSCFSRVRFFATLWTVAGQAPLSTGLSRQEYWVGSLFLLQGIFPTQELNWGLLHCKQILYQLREENKVSHCFHSPPPTICHEMMGPDALILVFWMLSFKPAFHSPLSPSSRGPLVPLHFLP